jgi:hypothetical protein
MIRNQNLVGVCIALVVGCLVGPMFNQVGMRPAHAAPERVPKWEQYCSFRKVDHTPAKFDDINGQTNEDLRARGLEGWELTSFAPITQGGFTNSLSYCFRRQLL